MKSQISNRFALEGVNPLRGLDHAGVVSRIEAGERGYYAMLMWTYRAIEKSDPMVRAVKRRLLSSVGSLKWDIKLADTGEDPAKIALAETQATTLRSAYDGIANLREALNFLALAELRGFSHLEKIYAGGTGESQISNLKSQITDPWSVVELRPVEQWFWARAGFYGPWLYNRDARETNTGEPIDPAHYIVRAVDDPAGEIFAELAVKRRINDADWDGFLEDYGIPPLFIGMPPNVPREREAEYQRAAELAVSAARGSLPNGASLLSPSAGGSGGAGVFRERLEYIDGQMVIAGTAGKLTVLSESGSGTLAGGAQKEAFDEIAQAIADQISGVMQAQFDLPLLARLHAGEPVLAYFEFAAVDEGETGAVLDDAVKAKAAGYRIDDAELSEKTGYQLTFVGEAGEKLTADFASAVRTDSSRGEDNADGKNPLPAASPSAKSAASAVNPSEAVADSLNVTPEFLAPAKTVFEQLMAQAQSGALTNEQLAAEAEKILASIPELALTADVREVASALERAMQTAMEDAGSA